MTTDQDTIARREAEAAWRKTVLAETDPLTRHYERRAFIAGYISRHQSDRERKAWLIEWPEDDNNPVRWWHPQGGWMRDANKACWFVRPEDAEAFAKRERLSFWRVTEHVFMRNVRQSDRERIEALEAEVRELEKRRRLDGDVIEQAIETVFSGPGSPSDELIRAVHARLIADECGELAADVVRDYPDVISRALAAETQEQGG